MPEYRNRGLAQEAVNEQKKNMDAISKYMHYTSNFKQQEHFSGKGVYKRTGKSEFMQGTEGN